MIKVAAANGTLRCSTCKRDVAAVSITLGNKAIESTFHLCRSCTQTLMDNLKRKEAPRHANTD